MEISRYVINWFQNHTRKTIDIERWIALRPIDQAASSMVRITNIGPAFDPQQSIELKRGSSHKLAPIVYLYKNDSQMVECLTPVSRASLRPRY